MAVFIDPPFTKRPEGAQARRAGDRWSHMFTDSEDMEELHRVAEKSGMRREWFQPDDGRLPHYDVTERRRARAIAAGAVPCTRKKVAEVIRARRARRTG